MKITLSAKFSLKDLLLGILMFPCEVYMEGETVEVGKLIDIGILFLHIQISVMGRVKE